MKILWFSLLVGCAVGRKLHESPVSRVVGLLQDLSKKLEKEADEEKDLYDKFVCWGKGTTEDKTAAVTKAKERIESLTTYIAEIDAGKVWFTGEKEKATEEVAAVTADIEKAVKLRETEVKDFNEMKESTEQGIDGLNAAAEILAGQPQALIALRGSAQPETGSIARVHRQAMLQTALKLGDTHFSKADSLFLHRILSGNFAFSASSSSGKGRSDAEDRKIDVIGKIRELSMELNLDLQKEIKEEQQAGTVYDRKQLLKKEEKEAAQAMLEKLEVENAARQKAKAESKGEIDALTEQNTADEKLTEEVAAAMEEREKQFDERSQYRTDEQTAISKAIEVLNEDTSRDTFASLSFFQESTESSMIQRCRTASSALTGLAGITNDNRLLALSIRLKVAQRETAALMTGNGAESVQNPTFKAVYEKIDEMITLIEKEEANDLEKKETCEKNKVQDTEVKTSTERNIDEEKTTSGILEEKIKELTGEIASKQAESKDISEQLEKAAEMRKKENAEFLEAKSQDEEAIKLLQAAAKKIKDFYDSKKSFLQMKSISHHRLPDDAPKMWDGEYKGAGSQSAGVVETIKVVSDDIAKEKALKEKEEKYALDLYEEMKGKLEDETASLADAAEQLEINKGDAETSLGESKTNIADKKDELAALLQKMKDAEPECNFYVDNYETRRKNRIVETDGLKKAKAVLQGTGNF